jgi:hypothetical protein
VWRGKYYTIQIFFPSLKKPSRAEVQDSIQKIYPGAKVNAYYEHPIDRTEPIVRLPEEIGKEVGTTPDEDPAKDNKEKKKLDQAEKRISMIKKLVLLKKRQAVNQGAGADVTV